MRILYLGCHSVLEEQELRLFTEMGHQVFSLGGAYQNSNEGSLLRGGIPELKIDRRLITLSLQCNKENIHQELIDWADIILMTHNSRVDVKDHPQPWVAGNWDKFKKSKKPIIWRSIGQSNEQVEESLSKYRHEGLKIVRYSPRESSIPGYVGSDALIRFYIDANEYGPYTGVTPRIVNVSQALFGSDKVPSRGDHMNLKEFKQIVEGFDWRVFGPDNENAGEFNGGLLSYSDLKQMLSFNRIYLYTGTRPASYTLALMEAMVAGIPVVAIGPKLANELYKMETYEAHEIIGMPGEAGYWSNDIHELREYCKTLLEDLDLARRVGEAGRIKAIEYFGKDVVRKAWEELFSKI